MSIGYDKILPEKEGFPQRLRKAVEYTGLSMSQLSRSAGLSDSMIGKVISGKNSISIDSFESILSVLPPNINPVWLLLGMGDMLLSTHKLDVVEEEAAPYGKRLGIPFFEEVTASAGLIEFFASREYITSYIIVPGLNDCDAAIRVIGDSMRPRFEPGDIILLKRMQGSLYIWGAAYLIVTRDHRLLKYVQPAPSQEQIRLVSANEYYQEMLISCDEILHAFLVKGRVQKLAL